MIRHNTKRSWVSVITETIFICNFCRRGCRRKGLFNQQYATIKAHWSYGSKKDGETHELHICEPCYDRMIARVKIKPTIKGGL